MQRQQQQQEASGGTDIKARLVGRIAQLESVRPTSNQYAAMTANSATRHMLGTMRRQWRTDTDETLMPALYLLGHSLQESGVNP